MSLLTFLKIQLRNAEAFLLNSQVEAKELGLCWTNEVDNTWRII